MNSLQNGVKDTLNYTAIYNSLTDLQKSKLSHINSEIGIRCVLRMWFGSTNYQFIKGSFCGALWDNVYCWPSTSSGTVVTRRCSDILRELHPDIASQIEGSAHRTCLENGTWAQDNKTIYGECLTSFESVIKNDEKDSGYAPAFHYFLFVGSITSIICLGLLLALFCYYRCFSCDRIILQSHLMVSLVLRFLVILVITEPLVLGLVRNYRTVDILCELVLVLYLYSTFTSTSWMFIQGLYLNITLMSPGESITSRSKLVIFFIIGWGVPAVFTFAYVIVMVSKEQKKCWEGYSEMDERWILLAPIIIELVVNAVFLLNILRILLRKVRNSRSQSDTSQLKAAAKAVLILFPVLGISNLLLIYNPGGEYSKYFAILNTFFGSTQGIFVAIVYCVTNKEVLAAVQRSLERVKSRRRENFSSMKLKRSQVIVAVEIGSHSENDHV